MTDLRQRIANLPPEKRSLLERRLQAIAASTEAGSGIPRRPSLEAAPLSYTQERLWFLAQLYPNLTAYNEASAYHFKGELDVPALQAALSHVVQRHEILRTTYQSREDGPIQVIGGSPRVQLPIMDMTGVPPDESVAAAKLRFTEVIEKPFDLSSDLMLRGYLYRLGSLDHILLVVRHHIASDRWSSSLFWKELAEHYQAELSGQPAKLPSLPVQYADYAVWQRERLSGEHLESQLAYWREELGNLSSLQLPADRKRPDLFSFRGAGERFTLERSVVEQLRLLALEESTTLYTVLLAAYAVMLSRLSSQHDIVIGTPAAGRIRAELESLIGFFVNTLLIRVRIDRNLTFRALLGNVRGSVLKAIDNQSVPFQKLVEILEPGRHLDRNPLINTTFQLFDWHGADPVFPHLVAEALEVSNLHAKLDLECTFVNLAGEIAGHWRYATDLFEAATIQRLIGHYQCLLQGIVADPDAAIADLPLLTARERDQLLVEWNDTAVPYPRDSTIHALFEAQAKSTPQATAVYFEGQTLTYAELNQRANQLAHYLISQGIQEGTIVGLALERSLDLIVAMLAILKASAAYLPLDTAYPRERITLMLEEASCQHVVTQRRLSLPISADRLTFYLDGREEIEALDMQSMENPARSGDCSAGQLAYVMFTSGSTGRPKGVMVPHRGVVRLVKHTNFIDLSSEQRVFHFSPIGFDFSTLEIWAPLLNGGQLFIYPPGPASLRELADYLLAHAITTVMLATGLFHQLVDHELEALSRVPHVIAGGDVVSPQHVHRLLQAGGVCRFTNGYGPTENSAITTSFTISEAGEVQEPLSIGRPINNTSVYVLDANLQPVPVGVPGELYTGGDGLALGYLNRPELTAAAFIPNPFGRDMHDRLYRTGDLARYLPDGNIEFLGRVDHQVKIRGFRVEPGEIEAILMRHPNLREAVVVAREMQAGDKQLVAYLVRREEHESTDTDDLRSWCSTELPGYMVPAYFIFVAEIPLTAHGKIDRAALPEPDANALLPDKPYMAPRSPEEEAIAAIWRDVLNLRQVGVHDNFFELGGHSLLATQVVARLEKLLELRLPLHTLFEHPTIAGLADAIDSVTYPAEFVAEEEQDEFFI
ncbi:MAG: non-ribosomal peptide synthetase [Candidatus Promineifilaceae bacterium]